MKKCKRCYKIKSNLDFYNCKLTKDNLSSHCKDCTKETAKKSKLKYPNRSKERLEKSPWIKYWYNARRRCRDKNLQYWYMYGGRGIKCLITKEEIKKLWFRDKAYLMKQPSIDRKDSDKHYTYDNCQFLEMNVHSSKTFSKPVIQYDLEGKFIKEWDSITNALKYIGHEGKTTNVSACCSNKQKTAFGYIWRYKNEN